MLTLNPDWEHGDGPLVTVRFTDGITNTLLKVVKKRPGMSEEDLDRDAVLMRAYGKGTSIIIDREKETQSHKLLAERGLAPPLLARFQNGLLYRFIRGRVCTPEDLTREPVWRGVARRLAEWHAVVPADQIQGDALPRADQDQIQFPLSQDSYNPKSCASTEDINAITPGKAAPNLWTVLQKWIFALPAGSDAERSRQETLQRELERSVKELGESCTLGKDGVVFAHCDLLSGNVIVHARSEPPLPENQEVDTVSFIDYEYATPCPAAFDLANHFAEWGGFDCDYNMLPTSSTRKAFLEEYLQSYHRHRGDVALADEFDVLFDEVDRFRGIPGFYWGIWALIQAQISQIDFDYASYAEIRLGEYFAWRDESDGTRSVEKEMPLRERRWAQQA